VVTIDDDVDRSRNSGPVALVRRDNHGFLLSQAVEVTHAARIDRALEVGDPRIGI
jgi:hypothetical protein